MNLTAITEPSAVAELHFLDCIALLGAADFRGKRVIDVGCGAGFPGVPLKIAEPSIRLTLLDSLGKRMNWLAEVLPQLAVEAEIVTARAEEHVASCRETYDIATSRAVARLNVLAELCLPYVRVGGVFLAMKGALAQEEVDEARRGVESWAAAWRRSMNIRSRTRCTRPSSSRRCAPPRRSIRVRLQRSRKRPCETA